MSFKQISKTKIREDWDYYICLISRLSFPILHNNRKKIYIKHSIEINKDLELLGIEVLELSQIKFQKDNICMGFYSSLLSRVYNIGIKFILIVEDYSDLIFEDMINKQLMLHILIPKIYNELENFLKKPIEENIDIKLNGNDISKKVTDLI